MNPTRPATAPAPRARAARTPSPRPQENSAHIQNSVPTVGTWVVVVTESGPYAGLVIRSDDFMGATVKSPSGELFAIEPGQSWVRTPR